MSENAESLHKALEDLETMAKEKNIIIEQE
jgi:hypothetical protein